MLSSFCVQFLFRTGTEGSVWVSGPEKWQNLFMQINRATQHHSSPVVLKVGSLDLSSNITLELVRNANSVGHPRPTEAATLGVGSSNQVS